MKIVVLFALSAIVLADGGGILAQQNSGPWRVTVFANPLPLRTGPVQLAVLVETQQTFTPVPDASVRVTACSPRGEETTFELWRSQGSYRLRWDVPSAGEWHIRITVERSGIRTEIPAGVTVLSAADSVRNFIPLIALVPACVAMFALNRFLRSRINGARVRA